MEKVVEWDKFEEIVSKLDEKEEELRKLTRELIDRLKEIANKAKVTHESYPIAIDKHPSYGYVVTEVWYDTNGERQATIINPNNYKREELIDLARNLLYFIQDYYVYLKDLEKDMSEIRGGTFED